MANTSKLELVPLVKDEVVEEAPEAVEEISEGVGAYTGENVPPGPWSPESLDLAVSPIEPNENLPWEEMQSDDWPYILDDKGLGLDDEEEEDIDWASLYTEATAKDEKGRKSAEWRAKKGIDAAEKDSLRVEKLVQKLLKKQYGEIETEYKERKSQIDEVRTAQNDLMEARKLAIKGAENRQQSTINQLHEITKEDPARGILGGSMGVAASIIGAIRQAKFGGKNRAEEFLTRMVGVEQQRLSNKMNNLRTISSAEDQMLQTILNSNSTEWERQAALKTAILQDSQDTLNILQNQFKIQLGETQLGHQTRAVFFGAKQALLRQAVASTPNAANQLMRLMEVFQKNKVKGGRGIPTAGHKLRARSDDDVNHPRYKDVKKRLESSWSTIHVASKMTELTIEYLFGKDKVDEITAFMLTAAPNAIGPFLNKYAEKFGRGRLKKAHGHLKQLMGLSKKGAYLEITEEQSGRLTERDFINGWERFIKPILNDPITALQQMGQDMSKAVNASNRIMAGIANEAGAKKTVGVEYFPEDKNARWSAMQKWFASNLPRSTQVTNASYGDVLDMLKKNYDTVMVNAPGTFPPNLVSQNFITGKDAMIQFLASQKPLGLSFKEREEWENLIPREQLVESYWRRDEINKAKELRTINPAQKQ